MEWNHLPVAGGIYDQHPKLIEEWMILFEEQARVNNEKNERASRKTAMPTMPRG